MTGGDEYMAGLAARLREAFDGLSLQAVANKLAQVGYETSSETVRRYCEAIGSRADAAFLAAASRAFQQDPAWLLLGEAGPRPQLSLRERVEIFRQLAPPGTQVSLAGLLDALKAEGE